MKFTREFAKTAHPDGMLIYRRRQNVPVAVKLRSAEVKLGKGVRRVGTQRAILTYNGAKIIDMVIAEQSAMNFELPDPILIGRGPAEFRLTCTGFEPNSAITGSVTVDIAFALFG
jgi:hypothetical protein